MINKDIYILSEVILHYMVIFNTSFVPFHYRIPLKFKKIINSTNQCGNGPFTPNHLIKKSFRINIHMKECDSRVVTQCLGLSTCPTSQHGEYNISQTLNHLNTTITFIYIFEPFDDTIFFLRYRV